jgi:hypothetical protein
MKAKIHVTSALACDVHWYLSIAYHFSLVEKQIPGKRIELTTGSVRNITDNSSRWWQSHLGGSELLDTIHFFIVIIIRTHLFFFAHLVFIK